MLNAGLTTLTHLKSRLLPSARQAETTWDAALGKLGLAIASRMEIYCARRFDFTTAALEEFSAANLAITLTRYPVTAITEIRVWNLDTTSAVMESGTWLLSNKSGVIEFPTCPGTRFQRLEVTYNGGWWLGTAEERSGASATATLLPEGILEAFLSEVQLHAEQRGLFEAVALRAPKEADAKSKLTSGLSDACKDALNPYRRIAGA